MNPQAHFTHRPPPPAGDYPPRRRQTVSTKRQKLIAAGKCVNYFRCHNERGEDGTETMCRPCAREKSAKQAKTNRKRRRRNGRRGLCIECKTPVYRNRTRCRDHLILNAGTQQRQRMRAN